MMLDMKRTFDEIVEAHADPDRAAQILANPFYQSLSSSFSGTQEYMAMEKLGQLRRADAVGPDRGGHPAEPVRAGFPGRAAAAGPVPRRPADPAAAAPGQGRRPGLLKVLNAGFALVTGALTKVLGAQVLKDVQTFVSALDTMFGGFRERADYDVPAAAAPGTAFLVVAAPEPDALREASYFVERLAEERHAAGGLVLNRVHVLAGGQAVRGAQPGGRGDAGDGDGAAGPIGGGGAVAHALAAGVCGCTRSGCSWRPGTAGGRALHCGPPAPCPWPRSPRSPRTCTTWQGLRSRSVRACGPTNRQPG